MFEERVIVKGGRISSEEKVHNANETHKQLLNRSTSDEVGVICHQTIIIR